MRSIGDRLDLNGVGMVGVGHSAISVIWARSAMAKKRSRVSNRKASSIRPFSSASPRRFVSRTASGRRVVVEDGFIDVVHPEGDRQVGGKPGVEADLPAPGTGFGVPAAGDDDRGGELAVHGQQVGRRILGYGAAELLDFGDRPRDLPGVRSAERPVDLDIAAVPVRGEADQRIGARQTAEAGGVAARSTACRRPRR